MLNEDSQMFWYFLLRTFNQRDSEAMKWYDFIVLRRKYQSFIWQVELACWSVSDLNQSKQTLLEYALSSPYWSEQVGVPLIAKSCMVFLFAASSSTETALLQWLLRNNHKNSLKRTLVLRGKKMGWGAVVIMSSIHQIFPILLSGMEWD